MSVMGAARLLVRYPACWRRQCWWRVRDKRQPLSGREVVHDWLAERPDARACPAVLCGCTTLASSVVIAHPRASGFFAPHVRSSTTAVAPRHTHYYFPQEHSLPQPRLSPRHQTPRTDQGGGTVPTCHGLSVTVGSLEHNAVVGDS